MANMAKPTDFVYPTNVPFDEENLALRIIEELKNSGDFQKRKAEVESFNAVKYSLNSINQEYKVNNFSESSLEETRDCAGAREIQSPIPRCQVSSIRHNQSC